MTVNRNDRSSGKGGGVFIATNNTISADPQPQLSTECEIVWSKIKMKNRTNLFVCSFYMPHRNMEDITTLSESVKHLTDSAQDKDIIIAGDFNCPNIIWDTLTVEKGAQERDVQQALLDFAVEHGLTQVHSQPTRDNNLLDLVFTTNPSLVKSSTSVPGISDHAMIVTDIDIILHYVRQKPRKIFLYGKADWENINCDLLNLGHDITFGKDQNVDGLWIQFKFCCQ